MYRLFQTCRRIGVYLSSEEHLHRSLTRQGLQDMTDSGNLPSVCLCGKMYRWGAAYVECHMDPNISKTTTGKERVVAACTKSQSTSCVPNRTRFLSVQAAIRVKIQCDKKTLLVEADTSKKRNLTLVGGYADNFVDLCGEGNADSKRPCLGKGQTMLTKQPSQTEFEECWSEVIIKNEERLTLSFSC